MWTVFLGFRHLFRLAKKPRIHRHPTAVPAFEAEVVDPILTESGWFKALGATPVTPGHSTLKLADAIRSE